MSPADPKSVAARLRQSLEMYEFGIGLMRQNLRRRFPGETEADLEARLRKWLYERPDETEWVHGRSTPWPRLKE